MNDEIASDLPNSLHDALLETLTIDYPSRRATFTLRAAIGNPDADTEAEREAYRPLTVTISALLWCVIESPELGNSATGEELQIDAGRLGDLKSRPNVPTVPAGAFAWWIYVQQWNAFIYVAGGAATVE
jgi:hypothetical protein